MSKKSFPFSSSEFMKMEVCLSEYFPGSFVLVILPNAGSLHEPSLKTRLVLPIYNPDPPQRFQSEYSNKIKIITLLYGRYKI